MTCRFVVVEEQSVVPKLICDACVSLRPASALSPCFAGWSPSPAIAVADGEHGFRS